MMSRKKRKHTRKSKDRRSQKNQNYDRKRLDDISWQIAKVLTQRKVVVPDWLKHGYWCYDVFGKKVYCDKCIYKGCHKEEI